MAHGTGVYLIRLHDADLSIGDYRVVFYREKNYFFDLMSDCYEPDSEWLDNYKVEICPVYHGKYSSWLEDPIAKAGMLTKAQVEKIWWNLKHRDISLETAIAYIKGLQGEATDSGSDFRDYRRNGRIARG